MLFVPGDSERKLTKAQSSSADALILDLEDSVAPERLPEARGLVQEYLRARPERSRQQLWVRINPLHSGSALEDLAAVMPGAPDGILLPKTDSAADSAVLGHYLAALEVREGLGAGGTRIIPVATETARAMFALDSYTGASIRVLALTWGAEDLSTALGAATNRLPDGELEFTYRLARSLCLLGARAAGVAAIDTVYVNFRDPQGLAEEAKAARRAGFSGKIAIHPDQVDPINQAFTPDESEVAEAKRIVDAFAVAGGKGAVQLDGRMLDRPHLTQAQHLLQAAARKRQ
jgi:citrate lyase subunit beta/citryl-CoA lyase